ncbi:MAG: DUF916 domain-containing protein [Actinomycetota bacterium]|nr:DUF916 domain-containing protein [Actinomycetota bacterium]
MPTRVTARAIAATLAALTVLATFLLLPRAYASVPGMHFSIRPASGSSASEGGDYFVIRSRPGAQSVQAFELSNPTRREVQVRLGAVDAATAQLGGVDYMPAGSKRVAAGAWIDLSSSEVVLQPGETEQVPFEVVVPEDAPSGTSVGGIAAWTPADESSGPQDEGLGAVVHVETRRVVAVQVELPGPDEPVLTITGVEATARPDGVYLQVGLLNEGHGFAEGSGTLTVGDATTRELSLDKVVPGTSIGYPIKWAEKAPRDGTYPVEVEIDYGRAVARYEGEVTVGEAVTADLADLGIGDEAAEGAGRAAAMAAVAAVALAGAGLVARQSRRNTKTRPVVAEASAAPAHPSPRRRMPPPPPPLADNRRWR